MGLAAAATSMAFAQEPQNFTSKLWNHDFEKGVHGWDITAESTDAGYNCWMPQVKGPGVAVGYYGYNNMALENWKGAGSGLKDNSASQTLTDLPDGTYVFGAYMTATNDSWSPSIDAIEGVCIFANEASSPVATHRVEGMDEKWAHSIKFNVATVVEGGTLKVGAKCEGTNASFVTMDNTTLWYFGNMSKADALNEMAKIDLAASAAIADTCRAYKMNVDTLAYLEGAIVAAKAITGVEEAVQLDEDVYWGMRIARKSIADYKGFAEAIAAAKESAAKEWSDNEETVAALESLNGLVDAAVAMYEEGKAVRSEIDTVKLALSEAAALLELDSCYILFEKYDSIYDELPIGEEMGEYTDKDAERYQTFLDEVEMLLGEVIEGILSAAEAQEGCEKCFAEIEGILANPLSYSEFPIIIPRGTEQLNGLYPLEGAYLASYNGRNNVASFKSPLYRFTEPLTKVRFIVRENAGNDLGAKGDKPVMCLGHFRMYDENNEEILLTEDMIRTNADHNTLCSNVKDGAGIPGMLDDNHTTYFHSAWNYAVPEHHYIEVTLPEGQYSAFSFFMTSIRDSNTKSFPAVLEITYVSEKVTELQNAVLDASLINTYEGTNPGFFSTDLSFYYEAIEEGRALLEREGVLDGELDAAIAKVNDAADKVRNNHDMPEPGKKYHIVSSIENFVKTQGVVKTMTIHQDSVHGGWLWWETACPDSLEQEFTFEAVENEEGMPYYFIKNAAHDLYVCDWYDADGVRPTYQSIFTLSEKPDTFELRYLDYGQFALVRRGYINEMLHALDHNSGNANTNQGTHVGSIRGNTSSVITWGGGAYNASGWYIRELMKLPYEAKSLSDLQFKSVDICFYEGVDMITLTADKECAFENLKLYDLLGQEIPVEKLVVKDAVASIMLEGAAIDAFRFTFDNNEGVETVTVNALLSKLNDLEAAYNTAVAVAPVEGDQVGQVSDLSKYNAALAEAERLLILGGTDEEIAAVIAAMEAAVAELEYNHPVAGQEYFIQSALPWMTRWGSEMDVFVKDSGYVYWSYVNIKDLNHRWKFVDCGMLKNGMPAYYLENVGTGFYLTTPRSETNRNDTGWIFVVEDTVEAAPFNIFFLTDGKVAITDSREGNTSGGWALHPQNHQNGTGYVAHGNMMTWGKHDAASAWRVVSAEKVISDFMTGVEDIEVADEQVAPAVKGIYDLYGRRIETPAVTGIYIVDGKKTVIKK